MLLCPGSGRSDPGLVVSSAGEDGSGQAGIIVVDGPTPPTGNGSRRMYLGTIAGPVGNVVVALLTRTPSSLTESGRTLIVIAIVAIRVRPQEISIVLFARSCHRGYEPASTSIIPGRLPICERSPVKLSTCNSCLSAERKKLGPRPPTVFIGLLPWPVSPWPSSRRGESTGVGWDGWVGPDNLVTSFSAALLYSSGLNLTLGRHDPLTAQK